MHRVVHQRDEGPGVGAQHLDHIAAGVVKLLRVVIEGNFSFRFAGGCFEARRLELVERLADGLRHPAADRLEVFEVS